MNRLLTGCLLVILAVVPAFGSSLTPTGAFSGGLSEGFEGFPNYLTSGGGNSNLVIMGGGATFSSVGGQTWIYEPGAGANWGLGGNGTAITNSGAKGGGLFDNQSSVAVTLTFASAVSDFGGYFAVDSGQNLGMSFFDVFNDPIDTTQFISSQSNAMIWYGWSSSVGIKSIVFSGPLAPVMDDLQANVGNPSSTVPEPTTMVLVGSGLLGLASRRRRTAK